jgi:hypothetical protein
VRGVRLRRWWLKLVESEDHQLEPAMHISGSRVGDVGIAERWTVIIDSEANAADGDPGRRKPPPEVGAVSGRELTVRFGAWRRLSRIVSTPTSGDAD